MVLGVTLKSRIIDSNFRFSLTALGAVMGMPLANGLTRPSKSVTWPSPKPMSNRGIRTSSLSMSSETASV